MSDFGAMLGHMTPEELERLLGLGTLDERSALLAQQMQQAQAIRGHPARIATPAGAFVGGLSNILGTIGSNLAQRNVRAQQEALLEQQDAGRALFANLLGRAPEGGYSLPQQDALGALAQLSGDRTLAPFGLGMQRRAANVGEQQEATRRAVLQRALAARQEAERNARELAEAQAAEQRRQEEWDRKNAITNAQNRDLKRIERGMRAGERESERQLDEIRAQREAMADAARKEEERSRKATDEARERYLEGHELLPEAKPTVKEAADAREAKSGVETLNSAIGEIEQLYKKYGAEALPGPAKARMQALATILAMDVKGPQLFHLGVITGPDAALLESVVGKPTGREENILDFFGVDTTIPRLSELRQHAVRKFEAKARGLGYRRKQAPTPASPLPPDKARRLEELRRKKASEEGRAL